GGGVGRGGPGGGWRGPRPGAGPGAPWRRPPASKPTASATPSPVPPAAGRARLATKTAPSTSAAGSSCTTSPWPTARPAAGIFSPQRLPLGLDTHGYSPVVLLRLVTAAGQLKSFDLAAQMARLPAEVPISGRPLGRPPPPIGPRL